MSSRVCANAIAEKRDTTSAAAKLIFFKLINLSADQSPTETAQRRRCTAGSIRRAAPFCRCMSVTNNMLSITKVADHLKLVVVASLYM